MNHALYTEKNLKQIVKYAKEVGPRNAALIARYTGIPSSTVRYSLRSLLMRRGIHFRASVNHSRIGLTRHLLRLSFDPSYPRNPEEVLQTMAKGAFLEWYGKTIPQGDYYTLVALPPPLEHHYNRFLEHLVESGVLQNHRSYCMDWSRLRSLDENDYDLRRGRWKVDWEALDKRRVPVEEPPTEPIGPSAADKTDLLILKEIQLDATQRLSKMVRTLNLTYRTVYYHYTEHVVAQGLINRFVVYPGPTERDGRGTAIVHLLRGLSTDELVLAENLFQRLPFTWMDSISGEDRLYMIYTALPNSELSNMFRYISHLPLAIKEKYSFELLDVDHIKNFTIPYEMMEKDGVWGFEPRRALEKVIAEPAGLPLDLKKKGGGADESRAF